MKKRLLTLALGALIGAMMVLPFSLRTSAVAANQISNPTQVAFARYPEIDKAMGWLNQAYSVLQNRAAHDFGGHRMNAMQHIQQALGELRLARQFANHR